MNFLIPDKMTDNYIIKALECCQSPTAECKNCPMPKDIQDDCRCMETISRNALSLINRQKAEVERLTVNMNAFGLGMKREKEKAEATKAKAIKEFLDRLNGEIEQALESNYKAKAERMAKPNIEMADEFISYCEGKISALRGISDFSENLAKEMVGDNNGG